MYWKYTTTLLPLTHTYVSSNGGKFPLKTLKCESSYTDQ